MNNIKNACIVFFLCVVLLFSISMIVMGVSCKNIFPDEYCFSYNVNMVIFGIGLMITMLSSGVLGAAIFIMIDEKIENYKRKDYTTIN